MTKSKRPTSPLQHYLPWLVLAGFTAATALFIMAVDGLDKGARVPGSADGPETSSLIRHLVVVVQENHSFDSYFGRYCQAPAGSNPTCELGRACCEAGPLREPGRRAPPVLLDDNENMDFDPSHSQVCELLEINGGRMDGFVTNAKCGDRRNFAYASAKSADVYWSLADQGALADRYFQPIVGASSSNDMYFARAQYVFTDNTVAPDSIGARCGSVTPNRKIYDDTTIGDLLSDAGVGWAYYAEGYAAAIEAHKRGTCSKPNPKCRTGTDAYPCIYDPSDNPFQYYRTSLDNPKTERDYAQFEKDIQAGHLPAVSFVKGLGFRTEHPGGTTLRDGMRFVSEVIKEIGGSPYADNTLILVVPDESGGYFDHVSPPRFSADGQPYGARVPLLAIGKFARKGTVSHLQMEHSSIARFIEWNWLGETGQLHGRDAAVRNIGGLLDPVATGTAVPND